VVNIVNIEMNNDNIAVQYVRVKSCILFFQRRQQPEKKNQHIKKLLLKAQL